MATHGDIGVSQPAGSTITMKVRTVTLDMNSTVTHQEVLTVGDAESSLGLARVIASTPPSTTYGLAVRIAGGPSSAADLQARVDQGVRNSSVGDAWLVNVRQSTATDLLARVNQGIGNSSAGDRWNVNAANSSAADYIPVRIVNSSGDGFSALSADYVHDSTLTASSIASKPVLLRASAAAPTAVGGDDRHVLQWALRNGAGMVGLTDGNGGIVANATSQPSTAAVGIVTRAVVGGLQTYAASTTGQASTTPLVTSNAASKAYVYAYTITSTASTGVVIGGFYSSNTLKWPITLSSGFAGANLAVTPPGYLFSGSTGDEMSFRVASTVTGGMNVGVAYWIST